MFGGRQLELLDGLAAAGVCDGASFEVLGRLAGGAKKRKKKTYTKPKKNKHKHKNVKLRMLKYYKVEDSGKARCLCLQWGGAHDCHTQTGRWLHGCNTPCASCSKAAGALSHEDPHSMPCGPCNCASALALDASERQLSCR